jgi:diguanylate cyclase (GGDEF)-like protein/PAS domain S-box-containing protein
MEASRKQPPIGAWRSALHRLRRFAWSSGALMPARTGAPSEDDSVSHWLEQTVGGVDFLAHVDRDLRFLYVSDTGLRFIGYHRDYLHTLTLRDLIAEQDNAALDGLLARATLSGQIEKATLRIVKSTPHPLDVELRAVRSRHRGVDGFAIAAFDVSSWRAIEARLAYEMHHDPMTGLDNLSALVPALMLAQQAADDTGTCAALLLLDLDDYQRINRALGYDAGDTLLRETAQRLQAQIAPPERLARVASDKFAVIFSAPTRAQAADTAGELGHRLQAAVRQPYGYAGQAVHLSASIGIALYPDERHVPKRAQHHSLLLLHADQALAQAKAAGGGTLAFHTPTDDPTDAERLKLEADLHDGVRNGEFSLHFQPITSSRTDDVVGVEALMRWQHPTHGLVLPATFIPLAESIGLINYLGNWVLKAACMQLVAWERQGLTLQYVSVNVSPLQFRDPRFTQNVRETIALTGADPHRVVLEITESLLMHDPDNAKALLEELTALGIRFAVDDFGTGYSSLAYLQRFPLSKLKIDRSFVENLPTSRNDRAIVSAVVGLAKTLELELVAEGVETEAQRELLNELGCTQIQGWLVCRALPSEELARRFEARQLHTAD